MGSQTPRPADTGAGAGEVAGGSQTQTQTQTQTQNSQPEWSQPAGAPPDIPAIWGRLYSAGIPAPQLWQSCAAAGPSPVYVDLIEEEFKLGRALTCNFVMKKGIIKEEIIKNVSKHHFVLKRDKQGTLSPAVLTDCSYNGTFVNGVKIGKGKSRVLEDNDEIAITHPLHTIFVFKDLLRNEQDQVPMEISEKYYISKTLGQGACGVVKLVYNKLECTRHAMKIIKKGRITYGHNILNDPQKIMNEVNILKQLRHPCIISTEEIFDSRDAVYIILELMEGGELFDRITKTGRLSEPQLMFLFRQMVLAVKYLHSQGITHRDLKPENVLLEGENDETVVKITDFGLSKFVGEDSFMKTMCGTPIYLAPEILKANGQQTYGPEVDVWSLGVIFFICLSGYLPFSNDYSGLSLQEQILMGRYNYSKTHWNGVSNQAKILMRRMLTVDPLKRITLDGILNDVWMQDPAIISRVNHLLNKSAQIAHFSQLSVSSNNSDEENKPIQCNHQNPKRMLSDSFCSSEQISKKIRLGRYLINTERSGNTSSAHSTESDGSNYLLVIASQVNNEPIHQN